MDEIAFFVGLQEAQNLGTYVTGSVMIYTSDLILSGKRNVGRMGETRQT
jgi:hypothetical protein